MSLEVTTNFKDSNGVDLGTKLVTKDYLISVYSSIAQEIGLTPELWVWGNNGDGQLGVNDSSPNSRSTPVTTSVGSSTWKQISPGLSHTAAIKTDGTLWTWGNNSTGQLGKGSQGNSFTPITTFAGGTNWKQVSAGVDHCASIKTDGTLWTWGSGVSGSLGVLEDFLIRSLTPITTFSGGTNWSDTATGVAEELYTISGGYKMSSAIKTDGTLWTWGYKLTGSNNNSISSIDTPITTFAGGTTWKQVSTGRNQVAAIKTDGTLWIWGNNTGGALGISDTQSTGFFASTPITTFVGGTNWKQVSCGDNYSAAVKTDGTLWTWGSGPTITTNILARLFGTTILFPLLISSTWADTATGVAEELYTFAGGKTHSAGIKTDGTLWTWGNNAYGITRSGQLGIGDSNVERSTPVTTFAGGTTWKQVSCGYNHSAAIKTDGTLWTWGNGGSGRLGNNQTTIRSTPVTTFSGGTNWKQVSAGTNHCVAVKTDGTLWTWGLGLNARLGANNTNSSNTPVTTFAGGTNWKQVSAGDTHTAAVKTDGTLWIWGSNGQSKLGINQLSTITRSTPVTTFAGGTNWKQVSCGVLHTAAVKTDGTLWTWGYGGNGRLGNIIVTGSRSTPVTTFAGGTNWKQVSAGSVYCAAVKTDGTLWTWGLGTSGQLGTNTTTNKSTPVTTFAGGTTWKQVAAGDTHTIALRNDGTTKELFSFGNNVRGQLGSSVANNVPGQVFSYTNNWKQVSCAAIGEHIGAIKTDGTLWTWGSGASGRLGNSVITGSISTPVTTFAGGTNWKQVSAGGDHCAAVKTDGTLWTWGFGGFGQLGTNTTTNKSTPVTTFAGGTNWKQVSSGGYHCAAIKTDGTLWTWGRGSDGELGTNTTTNKSTPVTTFAGGTTWKQVSCGDQHTLALSDDTINKRLFVFGNNTNGRLGIRLSIFNPVTTFAGGTNWKQVDAGWQNTAAIKTDGTLWTWGNNYRGALGINSSQTKASTPVTTFAGGTTWKQVSSGRDHCAAIKTDGTLWTWGNGSSGQLGNAVTTADIRTPVTTFAGGTNWKQVSAGTLHCAAVKTDGTLWTWGNNSTRQMGNNSATTSILTPVTTFSGGNNWKQVDCGGGVSLGIVAAIKTDGTLWTWGNNYRGALGINSSQTTASTPVTTFAGGTNWKQISVSIHMTAIKSTDII